MVEHHQYLLRYKLGSGGHDGITGFASDTGENGRLAVAQSFENAFARLSFTARVVGHVQGERI